MPVLEIRPQPGPQEDFLASPVDVGIYGGAAGGGKTWALLLGAVAYVGDPNHRAVIFRRTTDEITRNGGLWEAAAKLYPHIGGVGRSSSQFLDWRFPSGARVQFRHLEQDSDAERWKGTELSFVGFDQLEEFSEFQFFYIMRSLRSDSDIVPYVRATCNPKPGWLARFLSYHIGDAGFVKPETCGEVRHFIRDDTDKTVWLDKPSKKSTSFAFIEADLDDNEAMKNRDEYLRRLHLLPYVERQRQLGKNWKITIGAGNVFSRNWFKTVPFMPLDVKKIRAWDLAATAAETKKDDPDYTASCLLGVNSADRSFLQFKRKRIPAGSVKRWIVETAIADGPETSVIWEQEGGASGKMISAEIADALRDVGVYGVGIPPQGDKVVRANPLSVATEQGEIYLVPGETPTDEVLEEFHEFPPPARRGHDDLVDAGSLAYSFRQYAGGQRLQRLRW